MWSIKKRGKGKRESFKISLFFIALKSLVSFVHADCWSRSNVLLLSHFNCFVSSFKDFDVTHKKGVVNKKKKGKENKCELSSYFIALKCSCALATVSWRLRRRAFRQETFHFLFLTILIILQTVSRNAIDVSRFVVLNLHDLLTVTRIVTFFPATHYRP